MPTSYQFDGRRSVHTAKAAKPREVHSVALLDKKVNAGFPNQTEDCRLKTPNRRLKYFVLIAICGIVLVFLIMIGLLAELVFAPLLEFVFRLFTNVGR